MRSCNPTAYGILVLDPSPGQCLHLLRQGRSPAGLGALSGLGKDSETAARKFFLFFLVSQPDVSQMQFHLRDSCSWFMASVGELVFDNLLNQFSFLEVQSKASHWFFNFLSQNPT